VDTKQLVDIVGWYFGERSFRNCSVAALDSNHGPTDYESTIVALKLYMQRLARQNAAK
jgi:hypothetical protein